MTTSMMKEEKRKSATKEKFHYEQVGHVYTSQIYISLCSVKRSQHTTNGRESARLSTNHSPLLNFCANNMYMCKKKLQINIRSETDSYLCKFRERESNNKITENMFLDVQCECIC